MQSQAGISTVHTLFRSVLHSESQACSYCILSTTYMRRKYMHAVSQNPEQTNKQEHQHLTLLWLPDKTLALVSRFTSIAYIIRASEIYILRPVPVGRPVYLQ
ncbi:hypothetical protein BS78_10G215600 [Paspalum vaginatum]|nr:hypothetical protein BS78_10G215600 [Paspalum vaginatum]